MIDIVLVGVGGYAALYVRELLGHPEREDVRFVAAVDPYAAQSKVYPDLVAREIPIFDTLEDFFAAKRADLAVISTPIQFHRQQAVTCLEHGLHVLVEKPIAATLEDAQAMADARDRAGKLLAVGYQWCYNPSMLRLKADADAGLLGRPVRLKAVVLWPRDWAYYRRGLGWAGKKRDVNGMPIFDSVAANATAHYVENMLWLAGEGYDGARAESLAVETLRAYPIEMYDTITLKAKLAGGGEVFFVASHAIGPGNAQEPMFMYEFEKATVCFGEAGGAGGEMCAYFTDGSVKSYGASEPGGVAMEKLWNMVDAIQGKATIPCPAEAAMAHTRLMEQILALVPDAQTFDDVQEKDGFLWVPGLAAKLMTCYEQEKLYSEV